jgi:hypothetical protein
LFIFLIPDRMQILLFLLLGLVSPAAAPVPRCSPWIIINKVVEWNSLTSDRQTHVLPENLHIVGIHAYRPKPSSTKNLSI